MRRVLIGVLWFLLSACAVAQQVPSGDVPARLPAKQQTVAKPPSTDNAPPRSSDETGESSSKDTKIDISAPRSDAKEHPNSGVADDVLELRLFNPHKAQKAIEVGDFYFRRENFRAALSRYQEALRWKPGDAVATFKSAQTCDKLARFQEARANYEAYLKILPDGPQAKEARKALSQLPPAVGDSTQKRQETGSAPATPTD